jgi:RNA-directed DNA polymerase
MTTRFTHFTRRAREAVGEQFTALMGLLSESEGLYESYRRLANNKAPGVDGITKEEYGKNVHERLRELSESLRRLSYRPKPSRRVYIPKGKDGQRALGIPSFECKIVEDRLSRILQAIWEPEFKECSYGFRPVRNAHQALRRLAQIITCEHTQFVVEADIKEFFDNVNHEHMMRFLRHRIKDPCFLRIVHRFLKAGIMKEGVVYSSEKGTPQGGLVSPVLSNIYLHYVLDIWFERRFAPQCKGKAFLLRYADDFVACFQSKTEANRFRKELEERLRKFDLEIEPEKTQVLRFGSGAERHCGQDGLKRPKTFDFLGFTHYVTRSRRGYFKVGRKTQKGRVRKKLKELNLRLSRLRVAGGAAMTEYVQQHVEGHIRYYGISDNLQGVRTYVCQAGRLLYKWLNRRSQKRSINWEDFQPILERVMPRARIVHRFYPLRA